MATLSARNLGKPTYVTTGITNSCNFDHRTLEVILDGDDSFVIQDGNGGPLRFPLKCRAGSGGPFGSSCEAEIARNEIDGESNRYSQMEVEQMQLQIAK